MLKAAALLLCLMTLPVVAGEPPRRVETVEIEDSATSIYIGRVKLHLAPFRRTADTWSASYEARVVPLFFYDESGTATIRFTDSQIAELEKGGRVSFDGEAKSSKGERHPIEGYATADKPGSTQGKIKVRIHVSKRIVLVFNTTYRY